MYFRRETSRTQTKDALQFASEVFGGRLSGRTDALFRHSARDCVIAYTGLGIYAPVLMHIINDPEVCDAIGHCDGNILITDDGPVISAEDGILEVSPEVKERIRKIRDTALRSPGTLNENGEQVMDLKSYRIGSHYGVNLLLGDRSAYEDCLQSTPKAVLDEFGRGSFRGKQEKQVLATRYVLSPEENGEPANRQFYLTENGRQIF